MIEGLILLLIFIEILNFRCISSSEKEITLKIKKLTKKVKANIHSDKELEELTKYLFLGILNIFGYLILLFFFFIKGYRLLGILMLLLSFFKSTLNENLQRNFKILDFIISIYLYLYFLIKGGIIIF